MGFWTRLVDRIDAKVDRPANQSVLNEGARNPCSQAMIEAESPDDAKNAARNVRRSRSRRRWRWSIRG
jgi:hypothetical protein